MAIYGTRRLVWHTVPWNSSDLVGSLLELDLPMPQEDPVTSTTDDGDIRGILTYQARFCWRCATSSTRTTRVRNGAARLLALGNCGMESKNV